MKAQHKSQRAFTLIEVLAALTIFAIMAVMSYRALASVLDSREALESDAAKWRGAALFFARLDQDFAATLNRPVRSVDDIFQPAVVVNPDLRADATLALTRSGYSQSDGALAAPQRIAYRLKDNTLELALWPHLDMPPRGVPSYYPALEGVQTFSVRAMDANGNWQPRWPVPGSSVQGGATAGALPNGIEVSVTLKTGEILTRIFAVRGQ
jgi:general secretion pathway protein J